MKVKAGQSDRNQQLPGATDVDDISKALTWRTKARSASDPQVGKACTYNGSGAALVNARNTHQNSVPSISLESGTGCQSIIVSKHLWSAIVTQRE